MEDALVVSELALHAIVTIDVVQVTGRPEYWPRDFAGHLEVTVHDHFVAFILGLYGAVHIRITLNDEVVGRLNLLVGKGLHLNGPGLDGTVEIDVVEALVDNF